MNKLAFTFFSLFSLSSLYSQGIAGGAIHGNVQADMQYYRKDTAIGAAAVPDRTRMNLFGNIVYTRDNFTAWVRYENYANALQGYPPGYNGSGIPFRFVSYNIDGLDVTLGNFYDQFGNGLIFRTYEEKSLGVDNAMDGVRLKYEPIKGLYLKAIYGRQRYYFTTGNGIVRGGDAEIQLNEVFKGLSGLKTRVTLGLSGISKFEANNDPIFNYPQNVAACSGRIILNRGGFSINSEVAYKANDPYPSIPGQNIFKSGYTYMLTATYSQKGFGGLLGVKRLDNMYFLSGRNANPSLNELAINFLPPIAKQNTYQLLNIYPYATQPAGEMGYQGEVFYLLKPGTTLGGAYGTNIALNSSLATGIDTLRKYNDDRGYKSGLFKSSQLYYREFNLEITKKLNKNLKAILTLVNLVYDISAVQGRPGDIVHANIAILDLTFKLTPTKSIRTELQSLTTKQDQGNWAEGLVEYTVAPHWFVTAYDLYNYGNTSEAKQLHYFNVAAGYTKNANRISIGYGRQRAGLLCVGGVCRPVPASNGLSISITSSF